MTKRTDSPTEKDYDREYDTFWRPLLEFPNGAIKHEELRKNLYDFSRLIENVMKVYFELTGGIISKPLTDPDTVIQLVQEHFEKMLERDDDYQLFEKHKERFFKWYLKTKS